MDIYVLAAYDMRAWEGVEVQVFSNQMAVRNAHDDWASKKGWDGSIDVGEWLDQNEHLYLNWDSHKVTGL